MSTKFYGFHKVNKLLLMMCTSFRRTNEEAPKRGFVHDRTCG